MVTSPYPIPASARQTAILLGSGTDTYGPFGDGWGIFDTDDVVVETRPVGDEVFVEVACTIAKVDPTEPYDFFTVQFPAAIDSGTEFRVTGRRLHERELAITRGGAIDGAALEKELSKQAVVLQELMRDLGLTALMVEGDAAADAVAAALSAQASAAIAASNIAILFGNAGGTADALTLTHASIAGLVAYPSNMLMIFRIVATNTGAMTIAPGPLAAKAFRDAAGGAFAAGAFNAGDIVAALYNVTNDQIRLLDRHVAAGQYKFPATQNPSADPNILDDYEEGTWTPTLAFGGAAVGMTYGVQSGSYTKIGRLVFVVMQITLTAKGSSTGAATISGLPFANKNHSSSLDAGFFTAMTSIVDHICLNIDVDAIGGQLLHGSATEALGLTHANFNNTTLLRLSGVYQAAS